MASHFVCDYLSNYVLTCVYYLCIEVPCPTSAERTLEDHEKVLQCLTHWPRTHNNVVIFKNNPEKYYLLIRPQLLMPAIHTYSSFNPARTTFTEEQKKKIILKVSSTSS